MTPDKPDRRWYRLHRSTWVVGLLVILPLLACAFTAETIDQWAFKAREREWPYPFVRAIEDAGVSGPVYLGTLFSPWLLAADLAILVAAAAACMAAWEWRARRRVSIWQFRLAELFLLITAVAAALGWWRWQVVESEREHSLVEDIPFDSRGPAVIAVWEYCGPLWLRRIVPEEHLQVFRRPTVIGFARSVTDGESEGLVPRLQALRHCRRMIVGRGISDRDLARLGELPWIEELEILETGICGVGFREWPDRTKLKRLVLRDTRLNHEGLREVVRFRNLEALDLDGVNLNDAGAVWLKALPRLRRLNLARSRITSEGLVHLEALEQLQQLDISGTRITDSGLEHLGRLESLEELDLSQTRISDDGLKHLINLAQLRQLDLSGDDIADRAIPVLQTFPALCRVDLHHTYVRSDRIAELETFLSPRKSPLDDILDRVRDDFPENEDSLQMWSGILFKN